MEQYFTQLGATEPTADPEYPSLPQNEDENVERTRWYEPLVRYWNWRATQARTKRSWLDEELARMRELNYGMQR